MRCTAALAAAIIVIWSAAATALVTPVSFAERRNQQVDGSPMGVTTGDYNGDGNPDIAAANSDVEAVTILLGNGDGTFVKRSKDLGNDLLGLSKIITADVNHDGAPDLITSNELSNNITVLVNNADGTGTFAAPRFFTVGQSPEGIAVGFFDADANLDIATADLFDVGRVSILLGNGDGSFGDATPVAVAGMPYGLASGALNGSSIDLAATVFDQKAAPLLWGDGQGSFTPGDRLSVEDSPIDVVIGNFDGNAFPDVAVLNMGSASVSILLGLGDQLFSSAQNYAVGDGPMALAAADVNGDGAIDLVTADSLGSGAFFNSVSVLLGHGDGTFEDRAQAFEVDDGPYGVAVADFNRDGALDVVSANIDAGNVSVLLQCVGDCNADGRVTTDELVIAVRIALGEASITACPTFDRNGDERVTVNELVSAVNSALNVCARGSGA